MKNRPSMSGTATRNFTASRCPWKLSWAWAIEQYGTYLSPTLPPTPGVVWGEEEGVGTATVVEDVGTEPRPWKTTSGRPTPKQSHNIIVLSSAVDINCQTRYLDLHVLFSGHCAKNRLYSLLLTDEIHFYSVTSSFLCYFCVSEINNFVWMTKKFWKNSELHRTGYLP